MLWLRAGHIFTFMGWTGTLMASFHILRAHARAGEDPKGAFVSLERSTGIAMDAFATLAILFGVLMIVFYPGGAGVLFKGAGFFHTKLTLVAVVIVMHVLSRRKMRHYRSGNLEAPAPWMFPLTSASILGIVVLMIVRPM
jgi:uncharacterized membrane protein